MRHVISIDVVTGWLRSTGTWFDRRARAAVLFLDLRIEAAVSVWIGIVCLIGFMKIVVAPLPPKGLVEAAAMLLPYLLAAFSPVAGYRVAQACFPREHLAAQPTVRLCRYGAWRRLDMVAARRHPSFGPGGFLASLIAGILLNVPFRSMEFLIAVPAIGTAAPDWAQVLIRIMTIDLIVMNFFYMVCFVMALRSAPLFPRMLLFAWVADIMLQLVIAQALGSTPGLPANVADALSSLLFGNVQKVLISVALWLPYLILSERVNVTFRGRVRA